MKKLSKEQIKFIKLLIALAPPIIFQEILNTSVNMMDTMMIGRAMGVTEVASVGLANQVFFLFILMVFGILSGATVFSGQYFGKGDLKNIHRIMGIGFLCTTITAVLFFVPAFFIPHVIIRIYSNDPIVIELGSQYLRIISFSYFLVAITSTRNSTMRSMRQTKIPMVSTSIALVLNIIFNYLAIFVFESGLIGVAVSTLASRFIELIIQEYLIRKYKMPILAPIKNYFDFNIDFVKSFFKVSIFIVFNEVVWSLGFSIYNIAYGIVGTEAQGAMQISMAMGNLFAVFGTSMAITTSIIISNTLGASKIDLALKYSRFCMYFAAIASGIMGILLISFSSLISGIYNVAQNVEIYISNILVIVGFSLIIRSLNFTTVVGILRSGGDTKYCFYLETITMYLIGLPLAFLGAYLGFPIYIVFIFVTAEEVIKLFFALKRVLKNGWAKTLV